MEHASLPIVGAWGFAINAGFESALARDRCCARLRDVPGQHVKLGILPSWGLAAKLSRS